MYYYVVWLLIGMSDQQSVMKSELAVLAFSAIEDEGSSYTTEIARSTGKSQTSIDRIVRKMHDAGFLSQEKRGRAKYYSIKYDSIVAHWFSNLVEKTDSTSERTDNLMEAIEKDDRFDSFSDDKIGQNVQKGIQDNEKAIKTFTKNYLVSILQKKPNRTSIEEVLNTGLYIDLIKYKFGNPNHFPSYLDTLKSALDRKIDIFTLSYEIEEIVDEIEENSG